MMLAGPVASARWVADLDADPGPPRLGAVKGAGENGKPARSS
jgi:hypothetical protein